MDIFKKATKSQLRFATEVGQLTTEQLWSLNLKQLANAIKSVNKTLKESSEEEDELNFLSETPKKDSVNQLRFDILKEVYITKQEEIKSAQIQASNKAHNQKIMEMIERKRNQKLEDMSEEDLMKQLV